MTKLAPGASGMLILRIAPTPMPEPHAAMPRSRHRLVCLLSLASLTLPALGQLPLPKLSTLLPAGSQAGTTNEIIASGTDLDEGSSLVFSDPRVSASPKTGSPGTFQVIVPQEVPPGILDARFVGRFGVSNPRVFVIGDQPETTVRDLPTSPDAALELALDSACHARTQPNQSHWIKFSARKSQRVLLRIQAREIDSRLVPDLAVFDADQRELGIARRASLLDFTAPADGTYRVRIHDQTFRGGDDYFFRLTLDTGPLIEFAVPPVLQAGTTNRVLVYGRNLPAAGPSRVSGSDGNPLERVAVEVVAPALDVARGPSPAFPRRAATAAIGENLTLVPVRLGHHSLPVLFGLTPHAVQAAPEPSKTPPAGTVSTNATALATVRPPTDFGGLFPARGENSGIRFEARKGEAFWLEITSERLGFNVDPRLVVQRILKEAASGTETFSDLLELNDLEANPGGREFDLASRDVAGKFTAPEDGTYRVLVQNLFRSGPETRRLPYWLSLRRESHDFRLAAFPQPQPRLNDGDRQIHLWTSTLRRGETRPLRIVALRQDGFEGEIELTASSLPPGISAAPARIAAGQTATSLLLTATTDAPTSAGPVTVVGKARIGDREVTHSVTPGTTVWHVQDWDLERAQARPATALYAGICATETAPITVAPADPKPLEAVSGAKISIPFAIRRSELFPAAFNLKPSGHPEVDKLKEITVAEKATNTVLELNLAETKLPPGRHTLWLQGLAAGKYRNNPEALALAESELKAATDAVASASTEAKAAAEERRKAAEAAKKAAEERAKPRDLSTAVYSLPVVLNVLPPPAEPKK